MLERRHREGNLGGAASLSPEAVERLVAARWPGNLRQLDNIVRRTYALAASRAARDGRIVIEQADVDRALDFEPPSADPLAAQMWALARAFVDRAEAEPPGGGTLPIEALEALRGMALWTAVRQRGSRDDAFVLLGLGSMLKNRNHHRVLRRELERLRDVLRAIGAAVDRDVAEALDGDELPGA
jgi:DNA-binding NtrC family response regulator